MVHGDGRAQLPPWWQDADLSASVPDVGHFADRDLEDSEQQRLTLRPSRPLHQESPPAPHSAFPAPTLGANLVSRPTLCPRVLEAVYTRPSHLRRDRGA